MAASHRIGPAAAHWPLYRKQPFRTMRLDTAEKVERLLLIGAGTVAAAALLPLLPLRHQHMPGSWQEYLAGLPVSFLLALLLGGAAVHEFIGKPARNHRLGYRLVGQFTVRGRQRLLGDAWLELEPDDLHRVPVDANVYDQLQKGDTVEVVYSATKDLVSVRKIILPAARP